MKIMAERAQKEAQDWADLLSFSPPVDIYKDLKTRNMELQPLEKAYGNTINLDKFSVEILKLPTVNGKLLTDVDLLSTVSKYVQLH